jgi:penicillin-binding protein 2
MMPGSSTLRVDRFKLASARDVSWVRAHQYEHPELRAEEAPAAPLRVWDVCRSRTRYVGRGEPDELKKGTFSKENGYKLGDIIGKFGIERTYNEILTGKDGARRVIVDSRGASSLRSSASNLLVDATSSRRSIMTFR